MIDEFLENTIREINFTENNAKNLENSLKTLRYNINEMMDNGFLSAKDIYNLLDDFQKYLKFDNETSSIDTGILTKHRIVYKTNDVEESQSVLDFFVIAFKKTIEFEVEKRRNGIIKTVKAKEMKDNTRIN